MAAPSSVKNTSNRTRTPPRSAIAPRIGAASAITRLPSPLTTPSRKVLTEASVPTLQYCLKKIGKKPAITVVANAEFAQSYSAQPMIGPPEQRALHAAAARCSRVSRNSRSGQRSMVRPRLMRVGAR